MSTDIQAGKAAGVKTICVASSLAKKETLILDIPDILLDNIDELRKILKI